MAGRVGQPQTWGAAHMPRFQELAIGDASRVDVETLYDSQGAFSAERIKGSSRQLEGCMWFGERGSLFSSSGKCFAHLIDLSGSISESACCTTV